MEKSARRHKPASPRCYVNFAEIVPAREAVELRFGGERARLDLEVGKLLVAQTELGGGDRVAPHLDNPAECGVCRAVRLEGHRSLAPAFHDLFEVAAVDDHRARADGLHLLVRVLPAFRPHLLDDRRVRRIGAHVVEDMPHRRTLDRAVRDRLDQDVVGLGDVDVLLADLRAPVLGAQQLLH